LKNNYSPRSHRSDCSRRGGIATAPSVQSDRDVSGGANADVKQQNLFLAFMPWRGARIGVK